VETEKKLDTYRVPDDVDDLNHRIEGSVPVSEDRCAKLCVF
jgi:hypothetical protein